MVNDYKSRAATNANNISALGIANVVIIRCPYRVCVAGKEKPGSTYTREGKRKLGFGVWLL